MKGFLHRIGMGLVGLILLMMMVAMPSLAAEKVTVIGPKNFGPEFDTAIANFEKETGITVEVLARGRWGEMLEKVITLSMGGIPPDIVYGDGIRLLDLASQGVMLPLDEMVARDNVNMSRFPAPVVEAVKQKGKLYSMPTAVSIYANYYNVDMFDANGVKRLPTDWMSEDLGWDEFLALAKKLTQDRDGDGRPEQYALENFGSGLGFNMLGMWGLQDVTPDRSKYLGDDPKVIDAMEKMLPLWTELNAVGGKFQRSEAAMDPTQPNLLNSLRQIEERTSFFNWSLGVLPRGTARAAQASFHSIGITAESKHKEAAWKLVKYLTYNPEGAILFTRGENRVPVLPQATQDFVTRWSMDRPEVHAEVFTGAINVLWPWTVIRGHGGSDIVQLQRDAFSKILSGEKSVRGAMEELAPVVQALLDESK